MPYEKSLSLDLRNFIGKTQKILCDAIRSGVKQQHGYRSTKGLTDCRFKKWPIVIRFKSKQNREEFLYCLEELLSSRSLSKMNIKMLNPKSSNAKATRFIKNK